MKSSSKKPTATKKKRTKRTPSKGRQNKTKLLVLALAARMGKAGTKDDPKTPPAAEPIAKIKGNSAPGGAGAVYCGVLGDMVDQAVDDMEQAIMRDDEAALQKAIDEFQAAWDDGHRKGCYFSYV